MAAPRRSVGSHRIEQLRAGEADRVLTPATLRQVYDDIGTAIGFEEELVEVSWWFTGGGLLLLLATAATSLLWFSRLP